MNDVAKLWSAGFALGASFENTVVFERRPPAQSRRPALSPTNASRHKVLDVVGDLALAGLPLLGAYRSVRGGHKLNHAVLTALMADRSAWRVVEAASRPAARAATPNVAAGQAGPGLRPGRVLISSTPISGLSFRLNSRPLWRLNRLARAASFIVLQP